MARRHVVEAAVAKAAWNAEHDDKATLTDPQWKALAELCEAGRDFFEKSEAERGFWHVETWQAWTRGVRLFLGR